MPSPFPGMDPFLEEPSGWPGVHSRFINAISDTLAELVSPNFFVNIEERVYIVTPDDLFRQPIDPDVYLISGRRKEPAVQTNGTITAPTLMEPLVEPAIHDRYIEIRDTRSRAVVTTIEVLSPFNKATDMDGYEAFHQKRGTVMRTPTHWIEIDLLRAGDRPPEVAGKSGYYALLKRGLPDALLEVWFIDLRDRLPTIAVPLRPPFADVALDLQAVFDLMYRRAHYADSVDYSGRVPPPPLPPADARWVKERVQAWMAERQAADNA